MTDFDTIRDRVEDAEERAAAQKRPEGTAVVYRDPITGKIYDGRGEDAEPIEEEPEVGLLIMHSRTVSMDREKAVARGLEILEDLYPDDPRLDTVSVRVPHADDVDTEAAAVIPEESINDTPLADFSDTST